MNDFVNSIKADLLDRRLLPIVALVVLAFAGAVAYAVLGGGSSTPTPAAVVPSAGATAGSGVAVSQSTPETAVAETTGGISQQRKGYAHNPFTPLPEAKAKTAKTVVQTASSTSTGSSSTSGSTGSTTGSGGSSPTTPSTPTTPAKPKTVYSVAVLFGLLPAGSTPETVQLTPYENLKLLTPLPSAQQPLIIFRGVTTGGKSATFTLVGEAILHGNATCLPSASQCEAIDLKPGQVEQLEYVSASGQPVLYELRVAGIVSSKATSSAVKSILSHESKSGREILRHAGLLTIPDLHYSSQPGVLAFAERSAFAARARAAARRRQRR